MDGFSVYFRKKFDIESLIRGKDLNDRQIKAVEFVLENGSISNREYQELNSVSPATSKRELKELVSLNIFTMSGMGRATVYRI